MVVSRALLFPPFLPRLAPFFREQIDAGKTLLQRELPRPFADEHDVLGLVHHPARHRDRVQDPLDGGDAASALPLAVHNAGVELHHALGIGYAPQSHGCIGGVGLGDVDTALDSVEDRAALFGGPQRLFVGDFAKGPSRNKEGAVRIHGDVLFCARRPSEG